MHACVTLTREICVYKDDLGCRVDPAPVLLRLGPVPAAGGVLHDVCLFLHGTAG